MDGSPVCVMQPPDRPVFLITSAEHDLAELRTLEMLAEYHTSQIQWSILMVSQKRVMQFLHTATNLGFCKSMRIALPVAFLQISTKRSFTSAIMLM